MNNQITHTGWLSFLNIVVALTAGWQTLISVSVAAEGANAITISRTTNGAMRVSFQGAFGQSVALEASPDLRNNTWTTVAKAAVGTSETVFDHFVGTNASQFYRVAVSSNLALSLSVTGNEDETFAIHMDSAISTPSNTVATFITALPARGQLFQFDGTVISHTPTLVTDPSHRIQFRAAENESGSNYAGLRALIQNSVEWIDVEAGLNIAPVPDAPVAATPRLITREDEGIIFALAGTDADLAHEGDHLRAYVAPPDLSLGSLFQVEPDGVTAGEQIGIFDFTEVTNPNRLVKFVPPPNGFRTTIIVYYLEDDYGLQSFPPWPTGTQLLVDIEAVNDLPYAYNGESVTSNDQPGTWVSLNGADVDSPITFRIVAAPERGWLTEQNSFQPLQAGDVFQDYNIVYHLPVPSDCREPESFGTNFATVVWSVTDDHGETAIATNFIHLLQGNAAPLPNGPTSIGTAEDIAVEFMLGGTDPDDDEMLIRIQTLPAFGALEYFRGGTWRSISGTEFTIPGRIGQGGISNIVLRYVPETNYHNANGAPDAFTWTLRDLQDRFTRCGPQTVSLWATNVPDAPGIAFPWTVETTEDTPIIFQLPIIDPDLEGGGDTIQILVFDPVPCISLSSLDCLGQLYQVENDDVSRGPLIDQPGTPVTNPRGLILFVPKADAYGGTVFVPQLEDSYGLRSPPFPVWIHVTPKNDPPTAASRALPMRNTDEYYPIYPFVNDVDSGDYQALEVRLLSLPTAGRLEIGLGTPANTNDWLRANATAWAYYPPIPADCAEAIPIGTNIGSFHYVVRDPAGATAEGREQIDIVDINIPPVPTWPVAVTNLEDSTFEMATNNAPIVINLNDRDGDRVYFSVVQPPQHGRLYFQRRDETWAFVTSSNFQVLDSFHPGEHPRLFYVPDPDFHTDGGQPDSFSFRIMDWGLNAWRCEPVVALYVTGVNDPPAVESEVLTNDMNKELKMTLVATDADGNLEEVQILSGPNHGTLTGTPPNVLYTPNTGFSGIDAFRFNAVDYAGATSAIATVTIHVIPPCVPPPGGLVHWWRGESNGFDSAGMNHGSLQGGLGFDPGKAGTAFHFDGLDDWLHLKAPALATDWTAVFWVNRQDSPDASAALLMDSTSALKLEQYGSMNRNVGITQFGVADHTFNYTVPVNEWTHLAFVGTGSGTTLYVNGAWQEALPISIALPLESLGGPIGDRLKGLVDEIAVFKRTLTSAEIQQLRDADIAGMCAGSP